MKPRIFTRLGKLLRTYPALPVLGIALALTRPYYYADSYEYAHTIMDQEAGKKPDLFLEAGHMLWRPIGLAIHTLFRPALHLFFLGVNLPV